MELSLVPIEGERILSEEEKERAARAQDPARGVESFR